MTCEFTMRRRVEFAETDMAGIMHFSNYFRFMEATEHAFFRSLGLRVHESTADAMLGWARVKAGCEYFAPLRYEDVVEVRLLVAAMGAKSMDYVAEFRLVGDDEHVQPKVIARGRWTVVCVHRRDDGTLGATAMPSNVASSITVAPASELPHEDCSA